MKTVVDVGTVKTFIYTSSTGTMMPKPFPQVISEECWSYPV